jgi:hypothetical protein
MLGALALLLLSAALGGAGAAAGGPTGSALRVHASAGSTGWLALTVLALTLAMVRDVDGRLPGINPAGRWLTWLNRLTWLPWLTWLAVAAIAASVAAAPAGSAVASAVTGTVFLPVVVAFAGWAGTSSLRVRVAWTVPRLGMAATVAVLVTGSVLGTIAAWMTASGDAIAAASLAAAQAAGLAVPFVVLAATAIVEWSSAPAATAPATTAGLVQVGALALAAAATIVGVLTSDLAVTEANVPLVLGGIAIFLFRVGPALLAAGWARSTRIWLVTSAFALAVDAGLFAHVVFEVGAQRYASGGLVPRWLVFSVDHMTFAGVGTTALFGAVAAVAGQQNRWPAADVSAAAGLLLGIAGVALGLGVGSAVIEAASGAVFGLSVLAAAALASLRAANPAVPRLRCGVDVVHAASTPHRNAGGRGRREDDVGPVA